MNTYQVIHVARKLSRDFEKDLNQKLAQLPSNAEVYEVRYAADDNYWHALILYKVYEDV